jgi:hypothetical protein
VSGRRSDLVGPAGPGSLGQVEETRWGEGDLGILGFGSAAAAVS